MVQIKNAASLVLFAAAILPAALALPQYRSTGSELCVYTYFLLTQGMLIARVSVKRVTAPA